MKPKSNSLKIILGISVAVVVLVGVAAGVTAFTLNSFTRSDLIAPNVLVAGVAVGGESVSAARELLLRQWVPTLPAEIILRHEEDSFEFAPKTLGAELQIEQALSKARQVGREGNFLRKVTDRLRLMRSTVEIPVPVTVQESRLRAQLVDLATRVDRKPRNATVKVGGGDEVEVVPGRVGISLDLDASQKAVAEALRTLKTEEVKLVSRKQEPAVKAEDLAHLEVVLGSYSTRYSSGKVDRSHNLKLGVAAINGTVVMPGAEFSANRAIGPRLSERGFREAPIFSDGEITPATGGGVCQIATTIYNAALLAGLSMIERHHHSQPVTYAPTGRDATVYWGQLDLRFRNNTGAPIVVLSSMDANKVYVRLLGKRDTKKKVRVERSAVTTIPFETKEVPDPELEVGKRKVEEKGRNGIRVTVYRYLTKADGTEERQTLHTDTYRPQKETVRVGAKPPDKAVDPAVAAKGKPGQPGALATNGAKPPAAGGAAKGRPKSSSAPKPAAKPSR